MRIDRYYFRTYFGQNFPTLLESQYDEFLDNCIETVYTMFAGVQDIWKCQNKKLYEEKTFLCYGLLVAWYIADMYPDYADGVVGMGGVPVKSKKIGNIAIQYKDLTTSKVGSSNNADLLSSLKSNIFGNKAYMMIKSSGYLNYFSLVK